MESNGAAHLFVQDREQAEELKGGIHTNETGSVQ